MCWIIFSHPFLMRYIYLKLEFIFLIWNIMISWLVMPQILFYRLIGVDLYKLGMIFFSVLYKSIILCCTFTQCGKPYIYPADIQPILKYVFSPFQTGLMGKGGELKEENFQQFWNPEHVSYIISMQKMWIYMRIISTTVPFGHFYSILPTCWSFGLVIYLL